jgi:hypothetical protein
MGDVAEKDFTGSLFTLLKETFEGPPPATASAYLDQGCGLFQTVEGLSADEASRAPFEGGPTIAAHCAHAKFYLDVLDGYIAGSDESADWKQSWLTQRVGGTEWDALKSALRASYERVSGALRSVETWGERPVGGAMAIVAHTAYHLGAVRQLARAVKGV